MGAVTGSVGAEGSRDRACALRRNRLARRAAASRASRARLSASARSFSVGWDAGGCSIAHHLASPPSGVKASCRAAVQNGDLHRAGRAANHPPHNAGVPVLSGAALAQW